jgi:hypothetical protein
MVATMVVITAVIMAGTMDTTTPRHLLPRSHPREKKALLRKSNEPVSAFPQPDCLKQSGFAVW